MKAKIRINQNSAQIIAAAPTKKGRVDKLPLTQIDKNKFKNLSNAVLDELKK